MRYFLVLLSVLWFASFAIADITNFKTHELVHENYLFRLQITGDGSAALDDKVSGTKVENSYSISAHAAPAGSPPPTYTYTNWQIKEVPTLTIGGNSISGLPAVPAYDDGYAPVVRYASTHFDHDSQIQIQITAEVRGVIKVGNTVTYEGNWKTLNAYIRPKAYNVGKAWATRLLANGSDLGENPVALSLPHEHKTALDSFDAQLPNSKHKQIDDSPKHWATPSGLAGRLFVGTFIHGGTHGTPTGVTDSYSMTELGWATIKANVETDRVVPAPNLVCMFACKTLGSESDLNAPKAFLVVNPTTGATILGKGYAGFEADFFAVTLESSQTPTIVGQVSTTAQKLYEKLAAGHKLMTAIEEVNALYPVYSVYHLNGQDAVVEIMTRGDGRTRVKSVYRSLTEEFNNPGNSIWYLVLSS